mmetsp:Transcript_12770/g.38517  ORF Transcript_12770/g.38517 Transcript_12770/m.38517 type:complete len:339 (+) Transcript_12770:45-1061(+)
MSGRRAVLGAALFLLVTSCSAWVPRPGCSEVLLDAIENATVRAQWATNVSATLTREDLRNGILKRPPRAHPGRHLEWATINGTKFVYIINRKAGSKTWLSLMRFLRERGYDSPYYNKTVVFTFVRHPFGRLVSGYEEITKRHPSLCVKIPYCAEALAATAGGTADALETFENFVQGVLTGNYRPMVHDGLSYHVFTQVGSISRFTQVDFVGHLETARDDFAALFGQQVIDDVRNASHLRDLDALLGKDVAGRRYESSKNDQDRLMNFSNLSADVKALVDEYYKQDFFCFNYSTDVFTDLPWHHSSFSRDAESPAYHGGLFSRRRRRRRTTTTRRRLFS